MNSSDIKKHKNDVFRLFQMLAPQNTVRLPETIAQDLNQFLNVMRHEPIDLKTLGIKNSTLQEVVESLKKIYNLNG